MKIKSIGIENFRKLKKIHFECNNSISTIVGPNGVGKSSILEAIRLVKATLLASFDSETQGTLQNMGLFSAQQNNYLLDNLFGDETKPVIIDLKIQLTSSELEYVRSQIPNLAILRLQNKMGQSNRLNLISFLSTPQGQSQLAAIGNETLSSLNEFEKEKIANVKLIVNQNSLRGENGFHQELVSFIMRKSNYTETLFSIFPADRSFPTGDVNIQLGQQDINLQIQSYSIQPNVKFQRLKAAIISYLMLNNNNVSKIQDEFDLIFKNLIPGKELMGIRLETITGKLSVLIKEPETKAVYDIDFLSSGEKGLLLTLFLLRKTVAKGGIVLSDEPELHLNPAVLKNIIPFLKEYICKEKDVQLILTTHSAEILASTKEDEALTLLHLINEETISPIYKKDNTEAQEAIRCLGIKTSDLLFNKGVVYLEGNTDEEFISEVLKGITTGFKIQSLGGRGIVEKEIKVLQDSDKLGQLEGYHVFVLDLDNRPTALSNTENVKVIQWDRYSFENYLLNNDILYDVVKELNPQSFPSNRAEFNREIQKIAFSQIEKIVLRESYGFLIPQSITLQKKEIETNDIETVSQLLFSKLQDGKGFFEVLEENSFKKMFREKIEAKITETTEDWEVHWKNKCKGKELLRNIYTQYKLINYTLFIKNLIRAIKSEDAEEWKLIKSKIDPIVKK